MRTSGPRTAWRWLVACVAPGWQRLPEGPRRWLWPLAANVAGLSTLAWAVLGQGLFLPAALLLWGLYQALLATQAGRTIQPARAPRRWLPLFLLPALLAATALTALLGTVTLDSDLGLPGVRPEERVLYRELADDLASGLGSPILIRCVDGGAALVRVVGLPGDVLSMRDRRLCRGELCYPAGSLAMERSDGGLDRLSVEVIGPHHRLVLPLEGAAEAGLWPAKLPLVVADGELAVLPDNRGSEAFLSCTDGAVAVPGERLLGRPLHILVADEWDRLGLAIR
jgi:hypothetical protein